MRIGVRSTLGKDGSYRSFGKLATFRLVEKRTAITVGLAFPADFKLRGCGSFISRAKFRDRDLGGWNIRDLGDPSGCFSYASTLENVVDELAGLLTFKDRWIGGSNLCTRS